MRNKKHPHASTSSAAMISRLTTLLGSAAACALFPTAAFAQCAPTGPSDYLCENINSTPQVIAGAVSNVTTASGFSVNAAGGTALSIVSTNGDATYIDGNASGLAGTLNALNINATNGNIIVQTGGTLAGGVDAVVATQSGLGTITLNLSGAVSSLAGEGIVVRNSALGGDISVTTAAVTALADGKDAIDVQSSSSTADVTVLANGDLRAGNAGIVAAILPGGATGDINVTANGTINARFGIDAENFGRGSVTVNTVGPIFATTGNGIFAQTVGGNVTLNTGNVTSTLSTAIVAQQISGAGAGIVNVTTGAVSGTTGISARNNGTGAIFVTTNDTVTGTSGTGIDVAGRGAVSISVANSVTGAANGLTLVGGSGGTGDISVTGTGGFTGRSGDGANILQQGAGSITMNISGASGSTSGSGILVRNTAIGGDINVTTGAVTLGNTVNNAVDVQSDSADGDLTIRTNGAVSGGRSSVLAVHNGAGALSVSANGNTTGDVFGINVQHNGSGATNVVSTGIATGIEGNGISIRTGVNSADVTLVAQESFGGVNGIVVVAAGSGATHITANGNTTGAGGGAGDGIFARTGSVVDTFNAQATDLTIINSGTVQGVRFGINANALGSGDLTVISTGDVIGGDGAFRGGIRAANTFAGRNIVITSANARGSFGISAENRGRGTTSVTTTGTTIGVGAEGIRVTNNAGAQGITIQASTTTGATDGISVVHSGSGAINITATGAVTGISGNGIAARNATLGTDINVTTGAVTGGTIGIDVSNAGTGNTTVTSTGDVTGQAGTALRVTGSSTTANMTVNAVNTFGTNGGINVNGGGTGATVVNSTGTASGGTFAGINAFTGTASTGNLTVNANNAIGTVGVQAIGQGTGATFVNVTGNTSGSTNDGIFAANFGAANTDLTVVNAGTATGARFGIVATNLGTGITSITSTGTAIGGSDVDEAGIYVIAGQNANGLVINATDATGFRGIDAENRGIGTTNIVATGNVSGLTEGIFAEARATSGAISIRANNVIGGTVGIGIDNAGTGAAAVAISGTVQGGTAAISSLSSNGQLLTINNNGTIRNQSGLSADRAINIAGGSLTLNNSGTLLGTLSLMGGAIVLPPEDEDDGGEGGGDVAARGLGTNKAAGIVVFAVGEDDLVNNSGSWNSIGGTSDFGIGEDRLNNLASGRIIAATAGGVSETTTYANLETFSNAGVIALNDGGTGDRLITNGSVYLLAGSTLAFDIGVGNTSDLLSAGGLVTIVAGAKVTFTASAPGVIGDRHVFLTGTGLSGAFLPANSFTSAFKGFRLGYTANSAFVEFAQLRPLVAAGITPNQIATAAGVDTLAVTNPVRAAALNLATDAQAQVAFDLLSGEIHPTVRTVMTEDSRLPRNAVLERLGADRKSAVWGQAFGNWGDSDGNRNVAPTKRDSYGILAGADFGGGDEGGLIAGAMVGYVDTDVTVFDRASAASVKTLHGLVYGGVRAGGFSFKAGGGYAQADIDTLRNVAFPGFAQSLTDGYKGSVLQGFAEAGFRVALGEGYVEPYAGLTAIRAHSDAVAESGGSAAIQAGEAEENSLFSTAGVRFSTGLSGALSVNGNIGWQHGFGALDPVNTHTLAGSSPFLISGAAQSRNAGVFGVAARYSISPAAQIEFGYDGVLGRASQDHAAKATLRIRF